MTPNRKYIISKILIGHYLRAWKSPSGTKCYRLYDEKHNPVATIKQATIIGIDRFISPVNQETADKLIPQLLEAPGRKFLSCEPLLGPIKLHNYLPITEPFTANDIDWVIVGGESGHKSRPLHPEWVRSIRDQCISANVPFFFKQWGEYSYTPADGECKYPDGSIVPTKDEPVLVTKVGKSKSGRILDGHIYNEFPNN